MLVLKIAVDAVGQLDIPAGTVLRIGLTADPQQPEQAHQHPGQETAEHHVGIGLVGGKFPENVPYPVISRDAFLHMIYRLYIYRYLWRDTV